MGPLTREEYESRAERYDKQLKELEAEIKVKKSEEA
jgi:aldehyde:ferredoxin oxidoreductase